MIFQGKALYDTECTITIKDENVEILKKTYNINKIEAMKAKLFFKGNYLLLYERYIDKGEEKPLEKLNKNLAMDIEYLPDKYNKAYKNAETKYSNDGNFEYIEEENGEKIDINKLTVDIFIALKEECTVNITKEIIVPEVTENDLKKVTVKVAEFSTFCSKSSAERKHNIMLACQKIESTEIEQGEQFSFNEIVGERSEERGFQKSIIISGGEFVEGVGGGVCQVSTTLFNVWCLAGLKVTKSATHSLPVGYIEPSLDAMVTSYSDLVMLNDSNYKIYIDSFFDGNEIKFTLYGKPPEEKITLRSQVLGILEGTEYVEDTVGINDWQEGEVFRITKQPVNGLSSVSYRDFYDPNGVLLYSELLRKTKYLPQKGKIVYRKEI
jgi:vancomycin resistance protein YoaR